MRHRRKDDASIRVDPIELTLERCISTRRRALGALCAGGFGLLALMALTPIHQVAVAPGEIAPAREISPLEHFRGGTVAEVYVEAMEFVRAGAPIVRLDSTAVDGEIARMETRRAHLELRRNRLTALLSGEPFAPEQEPRLTEFDLREAAELYAAELADQAAAEAAVSARIAERRAEARSLEVAIESLELELASYREQQTLSRGLFERQLGTRVALLEVDARAAAAASRLAAQVGRRDALRSVVHELQSEAKRDAARRRAGWSTELTSAAGEIAELDEVLKDARARADELLITATTNGRILELGAKTAGDVIEPGGLVASIVPADESGAPALVARLRISPDDVGYVAIGDEAKLAVSAFDEESFGEVSGAISRLSPSSLVDREGRSFFQADVPLERTEATVEGSVLRLSPGMVVSATLPSGETTALGYLLEPVLTALERAMTERS